MLLGAGLVLFLLVGAVANSCGNLSVTEVGFNYVRFSGELDRYRVYSFGRTPEGLVWATRFYLEETLEKSSSIRRSGLVPLLPEDGFQVNEWYIVCGDEEKDGCRSCAVIHLCDCVCDSANSTFLQLSLSRLRSETLEKSGRLGLVLSHEPNTAPNFHYPLGFLVNIIISWMDCTRLDYCIPATNLTTDEEFDPEKSASLNTKFFLFRPPHETKKFQVRLKFALKLEQLRKDFPELPPRYEMRFPPIFYVRSNYMNSTVNIPIPFGNDRTLGDIRDLCRRVEEGKFAEDFFEQTKSSELEKGDKAAAEQRQRRIDGSKEGDANQADALRFSLFLITLAVFVK